MWKVAAGFIAASVIAGAFAGSIVGHENGLQDNKQSSNTATRTQQPAQDDVAPAKKSAVSYAGRSTKIKGDRRGHFLAKAKMNGRRIEVLVDTGATSVAINKSTARRLGIKLSNSDFKYKVNTANGTVKAASAIIDRIEIGRVSVKNVQAAVLPDSSLSSTLLGMSFLGQLRSFEVRHGELILTQ